MQYKDVLTFEIKANQLHVLLVLFYYPVSVDENLACCYSNNSCAAIFSGDTCFSIIRRFYNFSTTK